MRHPFPKSTKENGHQKASGDRGVNNRRGRRSVFTQALLYSAATPTVKDREGASVLRADAVLASRGY